MCRDCFEQYNEVFLDTPRVRYVAKHVAVLEKLPNGGSGCCLHITTDDWNIEDSNVEFCIGWAEKEGHPDCVALAQMFAELSIEERNSVLALHWGFRE